jgi:alkylated DNA repair dioxygenase AlkB
MFPPFLISLLSTLENTLRPTLPPDVHELLFPPEGSEASKAHRQAIVNRYAPGEGISPHVDLLGRYGDGIVGVSLGSGCVMVFERTDGSEERQDVYLPPRSVIVLTGEARFDWSHGIEKRTEDTVCREDGELEVLERETRVSVTFRWLLPGALTLGGP